MHNKNNPKYQFNKSNRFRNMFILAVLLSLVIFSILYFMFPEKGNSPRIKDTTAPPILSQINTTINETLVCDDSCFISLALKNANSSFCKNISTKRSDECWQMFSTFELSSCLELKNYSLKKNCIDIFIIANRNASLCDYLEGVDKEQCEKRSFQPCINVSKTESELCLALAYENLSYCSKMNCIISYAKERNNISACDTVPSDPEKYACKSVILNSNQCSLLSEVNTLNYCYQLVAQFSNDYSYCRRIVNDTIYQYACYLSAAIKTNNLSYCANTDLNYRGACYTNYSLETGNINGCIAANSTFTVGTADGCLRMFALKFSDPSACNYISDLDIRTNCYANTIFQTSNLTIEKCSAVLHPSWRDKCITMIKNL